MNGRFIMNSCRVRTTSTLQQERVKQEDRQTEAGWYMLQYAGLRTELAVLVLTADRQPAGCRGRGECKMAS